MTCNHCPKPCECGAEAEAGLRLLSGFSEADAEAYMDRLDELCAPQWPELEAMERALADYGEAA